MEDLPEDLQIVLTDTIYISSKVSLKVFAHVNKFCYCLSRRCAIKHNIDRPIRRHEIAAEGSLEVLKWALPNYYVCQEITVCESAAKNGHLHILEWLKINNCYYHGWSISGQAAENGHCHILEWIHRNGLSMSAYLYSYAASKGHLNVLKWAQSIGYVDSDKYVVCRAAVLNGHFEVVKWASSNGYSWTPDIYSLAKLKWPEFF